MKSFIYINIILMITYWFPSTLYAQFKENPIVFDKVENGYILKFKTDVVGARDEEIYTFHNFSIFLSDIFHNYSSSGFNNFIFSTKHKEVLKISLPYVEDLLTEVAYEGVETMLIEGLNNLHTNMYLKQFFPDSYMYHIGRNERYGFIWMEELVNFTEKFYLTRSIFPTIKNFMPEIVSKFNEIGTRIDSIDYDFKNSSPRVKEISPNPEQAVECSTNIIKINF